VVTRQVNRASIVTGLEQKAAVRANNDKPSGQVLAPTASEGALEHRAQSLSLGGGKRLDLRWRLVETL